jgi:hypothetical protein
MIYVSKENAYKYAVAKFKNKIQHFLNSRREVYYIISLNQI